jgi:starch synthase
VSPTYADEIRTPAHGQGLDGVLRHRGPALTGILNGMDTVLWNPAADPHLVARYAGSSLQEGKAANKSALQGELGLDPDPRAPLLAFVGRLAHQKGVDLLLDTLDPGGGPWQLAVLGSGEAHLAARLRALAARVPGRVAVRLGYDEPLAHRIQAGADVLLVPSRYEPCGLVQMYAMRYGTVPVVHGVGGLADTVTDAADAGPRRPGTGFVFREFSAAALRGALARAFALYADRSAWHALQRAGMAQDFSWTRAARAYAALYRALAVPRRATRVGRAFPGGAPGGRTRRPAKVRVPPRLP